MELFYKKVPSQMFFWLLILLCYSYTLQLEDDLKPAKIARYRIRLFIFEWCMYTPHNKTWRCLTVQAILYYAHFLYFPPFSFSLRYKGKNKVPENDSLGWASIFLVGMRRTVKRFWKEDGYWLIFNYRNQSLKWICHYEEPPTYKSS